MRPEHFYRFVKSYLSVSAIKSSRLHPKVPEFNMFFKYCIMPSQALTYNAD